MSKSFGPRVRASLPFAFLPLLLASSLGACAGEPMDGPFGGDKADEFAADAGPDEGEDQDAGADDLLDDGYEEARNVDQAIVILADETLSPESYAVPPQDSGTRLGGTEFWQRFPGGEMPLFSYAGGTELGRRCMYASAVRFAAIMADPPEQILEVMDTTNWSGSFFNWNDDFSGGEGSATGARLWAWRTGLIKWISQTHNDGTCHLPTRDMVIAAAEDCLLTAERDDGEIQGCSAR